MPESEQSALDRAPSEELTTDEAAETSAESVIREELAAYYRGPLPPAAELRNYDSVVPGLADRIVRSWESESEHRRSLDRHLVESEVQLARMEGRLRQRGQIIAATLAVLFFGGSVYLVGSGFELAGMAVVIAEIAALAGVFYLGHKERTREQELVAEKSTGDQHDRA